MSRNHARERREQLGHCAIRVKTSGSDLFDDTRQPLITFDALQNEVANLLHHHLLKLMATRGSLGGLARATSEVVKLLDAFGKAWILIESVGVGQTELQIATTADTTVVVLTPESGDTIQAMKAGLLEVADVFVVNKADRPGSDLLTSELTLTVHLHRQGTRASEGLDWEVPVIATKAHEGAGVTALFEAIQRHRAVLAESGALERRRAARRRHEFQEMVVQEIRDLILQRVERDQRLARVVEEVASGRLDPYSAVAELLASVLGGGTSPFRPSP